MSGDLHRSQGEGASPPPSPPDERQGATGGHVCPRCGNPILDHHTARVFSGRRHHRVCALEARLEVLEQDVERARSDARAALYHVIK